MTKARSWMTFATPLQLVTVPCPVSPFATPFVGRVDAQQLANGDLSLSTSTQRRQDFKFDWRGDRDDIQPLLNLFGGLHGGPPFSFFNPMASIGYKGWRSANVLARHWSAPGSVVKSRGTRALMPPMSKYTFPSDGLQPNPFMIANAVSGRTGLPTYALKGAWPRTGSTQKLPDLTFPAGGVPFFWMPVPAGYYVYGSAWGSLIAGTDGPIRYCVCPEGQNPATAAAATIGTLTLRSDGVSGGNQNTNAGYQQMSATNTGNRFLYIWLGETRIANPGTGSTVTIVAAINAMDVFLSKTSPAIASYNPISDAFQRGNGQMPVRVSEDTITMDNYTMVRGGDIALSVPTAEVYLPW